MAQINKTRSVNKMLPRAWKPQNRANIDNRFICVCFEGRCGWDGRCKGIVWGSLGLRSIFDKLYDSMVIMDGKFVWVIYGDIRYKFIKKSPMLY